jgi:hypothetical protein
MSKLVCPKCGNNRFEVIAHVTETWEVDEHGEYCDTLRCNEDVVARPDIDSGHFLFTCRECDTEAVVVP